MVSWCNGVKFSMVLAVLFSPFRETHAQEDQGSRAEPVVKVEQSNEQHQVLVVGSVSDIDERRNSIAGKIIVGRKTIEESGVTNVYDLLKRQPSVTVSANGRLGLMGMPGYTQILVDGNAAVSGKNPFDIDVVHVERIEIIKSANAEFGPYGSAGTINIVSRKISRHSKTQLRSGLTAGAKDAGANISWETNRSDDGVPVTYAMQASASRTDKNTEEKISLLNSNAGGDSLAQQYGNSHQDSKISRFSGGATVTWQPNALDKLSLEPGVMAWSITTKTRDNNIWIVEDAGPSTSAQDVKTPFTSISLPLRWNRVFRDRSQLAISLSPTRFLVKKNLDRLDEFYTLPAVYRTRIERSERSADFLKADYTTKLAAKHMVKLGGAIGRNSEDSIFSSRINDSPDASLARLGFDKKLIDRKYNFFIQDSAQLNKNVGGNVGIAFEKRNLRVREGDFWSESNYSLLSPSANFTWRDDEDSKNQIRLGIARTFNAPFSDQLSVRPDINPLAPCLDANLCGANSAEFADRVGNRALRPEKSLGLNFAIERYVADDTVLTFEVFARKITDVIGTDLVRLDVPWASAPRYVLRPENLGTAWTRGASVEVQILASDIWDNAPKIELQGALSVARSKISMVPGPDNRIADQSPWSAKLGAVYNFTTMPLKVNFDMNIVPSSWVRTSIARRIYQDRRLELSADGAWTFSPKTKLRLNISQLGASSISTQSDFLNAGGNTTTRFSERKISPGIGLRLEQKF